MNITNCNLARFGISLSRARLLAVAALMSCLAPLMAQNTFTWDGGDGASLLWNAGTNWSTDVAPANNFNANLTFAGVLNTGSAAASLTNNLTTGTVTNFTFSAGAGSFYIAGNTFTNRGNMTNNSGVPQVINAGMVLGQMAGTNNVFGTNMHFINVGSGGITNGGPITAPTGNAPLAKVGSGTLVFNSPLTNTIANGTPGGVTGSFVPGFSVDEGTMIFDGGPTSIYNVAGELTFGRYAPQANKGVNVIINSGSLIGTTWFGISRGTSNSVSSTLTLNGSAVCSPVNWSACYNAGDATKFPVATVTHNGTSLFFINNNAATANFSESPNAFLTHIVNDSATLRVGTGVAGQIARARVGIGGRAVIKSTSATAKIIFGQMHMGDQVGGAGVLAGSGAVYNRGIFTNTSPASTDHFSIGSAGGTAVPTNNGYGYFLNDSATPITLNEIGIGGAGNGDGVLEIRQGTININNWITLTRGQSTTAGAQQSGLLMIRNGTMVGPNANQDYMIQSASGISQFAVMDIGAGGKLGSAGTAHQLNLANANNALSSGTLTLSGGGIIEITSVYAGTANPLACVNFNNGIFKAFNNTATMLGNNLDGVFVHSGGATIDTAGFTVSAVPSLQAPSGNGISSIPVNTTGVGYIGRPIVRISDSTGIGATAIADWSETNGTVTNITITCSGSGYSAPTVLLVGGGYTNLATLGAPVLGAVASGGFTKTGDGTLTLIGGSTYTGATLVKGGTLSVNPTVTTPTTAGDLTITNAGLAVDTSSGTPLPVGNLTLQNSATNTFSYGTLVANPTTPAINASGSLSAPGTALIINISGFGLQNGQFPLIKYTGAALGSIANFALGALPPGVSASLVNNTANLSIDLLVTGTGQNLSWYGLKEDGINVSSNWDITLTTNWVTVGTMMPALRYQEYTGGGNTVGDPVAFDDTLYNDGINPRATNLNLTTTVRPYQFLVNSTLPYSFSGPGTIAGTASIVKSNTGSLTLGTSNAFTGGVKINAGSVIVSNDFALGASSGAVTMNSGTLEIRGSFTNTRPFSFPAQSTFNVNAGVTALLGGTFSGTGRQLFDGTGTTILTNNESFAFHVYNGTLVFDGNARITNNIAFASVGVGTTPTQNGNLILRGNSYFEINPDFNVGDIVDAVGRVDVQGNAVFRTRQFWLGKNNSCQGRLYQTGGAVTNYDTGGNDWRIAGNDATGTGTFGGYYLSGGRLDVQKNFQIGAYGTGELLMTGGTFNQLAGYPVIGRFTNGTGYMTVGGGTFNQLNTGNFLIVGENGTGTLTISNTGVVNLTNSLRIAGNGANGTVNLVTGGLLTTPGVIQMASGVSQFNFDGGTLQARGVNGIYMQGLNAATVRAGGARIDSAGSDIAIAQPLLDGGTGGGLTKVGNGTLTLSGASTYTGSTLVSTGRVLVTPAFLGTGAVKVSDNATFGVAQTTNGSVTVPSVTLGAGGASSLDFSTGTNGNPVVPILNVTGSLSVTGTCSVHLAGKLSVGTFPIVSYSGALGGPGAFNSVVAGPQGMVASLSNDVANSIFYVTIVNLGPGIVWSGTNSAAGLTNLWDLNSTTNWLVSGARTTYIELVPPGDSVRFDDTGSGIVILSNNASPTSVTISNVSKAYTMQGTGRISGSTGINKTGAATVAMNLANNDYAGDTIVGAGTWQIGNGTAIPDGAGKGNLIVSNAATVELNGAGETINGLSGSGTVNNSNSTNVVITVGGGNADANWAGTINNSGGGIALTKTGGGTMIVTGTNTFNNGTASQVNGGNLILTNGGYIVTPTAEFWIGQVTTGSVVVATGGKLEIANNWLAIGRGSAVGNGTLTVNGGSVVKSGNNNIVLGSLGGTGTIILNGGSILNSGMLWLGEGPTANGYLYLNGGLIQASQVRPNNNGGLPVQSIAYFNGGTLQATANSADFIQSTPLIQTNGLVLDDGGFVITQNTVALQEDPGSTGGGLIKKGTGTLYLNTASTYTGLTVVTNGTLAGIGSIFGSVVVAPAGTIGAGLAAGVGTFTMNTNSLTLQGNASMRVNKTGGTPTSDLITGVGTLNYGGTLTVTNITSDATPLVAGDTFTLFGFTNRTGSVALVAAAPGTGLHYSFNPTNGVLSVLSNVALNPTNITVSVSGSTLTLSWPADHLGWILQSQTNTLSVGLSNNWFDVPSSGSSTQSVLTINPANPALFFRLRSP